MNEHERTIWARNMLFARRLCGALRKLADVVEVEAGLRWLLRKCPAFGGRRPIDMLQEGGKAAREVVVAIDRMRGGDHC